MSTKSRKPPASSTVRRECDRCHKFRRRNFLEPEWGASSRLHCSSLFRRACERGERREISESETKMDTKMATKRKGSFLLRKIRRFVGSRGDRDFRSRPEWRSIARRRCDTERRHRGRARSRESTRPFSRIFPFLLLRNALLLREKSRAALRRHVNLNSGRRRRRRVNVIAGAMRSDEEKKKKTRHNTDSVLTYRRSLKSLQHPPRFLDEGSRRNRPKSRDSIRPFRGIIK